MTSGEPEPNSKRMGEIFAMDGRIRYFGLLDEMGKTVEGGMRPGLVSLEPDDEAERVDTQMALIRGVSEGASAYLGTTNFVIIHRDKLMLIAFPAGRGRTYLVTTQPDFPLEKVPALMNAVRKA